MFKDIAIENYFTKYLEKNIYSLSNRKLIKITKLGERKLRYKTS